MTHSSSYQTAFETALLNRFLMMPKSFGDGECGFLKGLAAHVAVMDACLCVGLLLFLDGNFHALQVAEQSSSISF